MAYVKAIVSERVRKHLATPEQRRAFLEAFLGLRPLTTIRFETVGKRDVPPPRLVPKKK